jgi:hypothetical protein
VLALFIGAPDLLLLESADVHGYIVFLEPIIQRLLSLQNALAVFLSSDEVSLREDEPTRLCTDVIHEGRY